MDHQIQSGNESEKKKAKGKGKAVRTGSEVKQNKRRESKEAEVQEVLDEKDEEDLGWEDAIWNDLGLEKR